jgi:voltage-gated potassium channel
MRRRSGCVGSGPAHARYRRLPVPVKKRINTELKPIGYELFIGALSVLSILNLVLLLFVKDPALETVIYVINGFMMPIFVGDFLYRFFTAQSKSGYFFRSFGWADLISSLPFPQLKILRMFRLWRVYRLFLKFGARNLLNEFLAHRADNALFTVVFLVMCVLEFGALAVLKAELSSPNANITTASDAIWWAYVTITTVGYGDRFPTTSWGRIIGILVMTAGVGLFGTLAGFLSNKLLTQPVPKEAPAEASADAADPKVRIAELKRMIEAQEKATADLRAKLDEIDQLL